jgi:RHS repeat-associated protein
MGDHLGSTSLVVNTSGAQVAKRSYLPFGAQWAASGSLPTDFGFTGQREADEIGLYYYVARWLDPEIAHFAQADTIVPGAGNPAAYNRYGYVMYNPVKYTDPSGHWKCDDHSNPDCAEIASELAMVFDNQGLIIGGYDYSQLPDWIPTRDADLFLAYMYMFFNDYEVRYGLYGQFSTSGYALAMYIAENQVSIYWDDAYYLGEEMCGDRAGGCVRNDFSDVIFVQSEKRKRGDTSFRSLGVTIAHEAFHLTDPFNTVVSIGYRQNSQYEELYAFQVSNQVTWNPQYQIIPFESTPLNRNEIEIYFIDEIGKTLYESAYTRLPFYPSPFFERAFGNIWR